MSQNNNEQQQLIELSEEERAKGITLREHVYDGIQEFDQQLPNWWLFTFFAAIVTFFLVWLGFYQFGIGRSDSKSVKDGMAKIQAINNEKLRQMLSKLDDNILVNEWATNSDIVKKGREVFIDKGCNSCHGEDLSATAGGKPMAGRPLNDGQWAYGATPMAQFNLIMKGSPADSAGYNGAKMEAWGNSGKLSPEQVAQVVAYLISANPEDFKSLKK